MKKLAICLLVCVLTCGLLFSGCSTPTSGKSAEAEKPVEKEIVLKAVSYVDMTNKEDSVLAYKMFIDRVNEAAKGKLKIEIVGGPEVIPISDQASSTARGVVDMVMTYTAHSALVPMVNVVGLSKLTPWEEREVGFFDILDKAHQEKGLKVLGRVGTDSGFYIYSRDKIGKTADFKGKKIRSHSGYDPIFKALEAVPINMSLGEMYGALERGVIDACPYSPYAYDYGLHEVCKYVLDHPFWTSHTTFVYMNLEKFSSLPKELQDLMANTAEQVERDMVEACDKLKQEEIERIKAAGVEYVKFSPEEADKYLSIAYGARWDAIEAMNVIPKDQFDKVKEMISNK